jgi:hypothetical protein
MALKCVKGTYFTVIITHGTNLKLNGTITDTITGNVSTSNAYVWVDFKFNNVRKYILAFKITFL